VKDDKLIDDFDEKASQDGRGSSEQEAQEPVEAAEQQETPEAEQPGDYLADLQRERAEFSNYKKRIEKERSLWGDAIKGDLALSLLPVLDDFDRAVENMPEDGTGKDWVNGILLIHRKLQQQLEALGVEEISAVGEEFDPALHEAVTHEESADHEPHQVIGVVRKGYRLGDKILRPALVRVAS
jgi:molecular chaperone GrpE